MIDHDNARADKVKECYTPGHGTRETCREASQRERETCRREVEACHYDKAETSCDAPTRTIVVVKGKRQFAWGR